MRILWSRIGALAVACCVVVIPGTAASATPKPLTPERLFTLVAPGMVKVVTPCPKGLVVGSGFLVGPRTMITADHVLPPKGCRTSSVKQEGTGSAALVDNIDDYKADDIAVVHLSAPITGAFYFAIANHQPKLGTPVVGLGYSLGNPLGFNQGSVVLYDTTAAVPTMAMNLLGAEGSSGGPILTLDGQVVGLTQRGAVSPGSSYILSVDLANLAPRGRAFCQGAGKLSPSTLCGTYAPSRLVGGAPKQRQATLPKATPPTLAAPSPSARAYNAQTIQDKANHVSIPQIDSGDSVDVGNWNAYLRLALLGNQDPYGKPYQATYVRCWLPAAFRVAAAKPGAQVFTATTGPLGFYTHGSSWINVALATCVNGAKAARGQLTQTSAVALASILHETFNRQGIQDEADLGCLGAVGVWEAVNRRAGAAPANRAWSLVLDWYAGHLAAKDVRGFESCTARFSRDWNG